MTLPFFFTDKARTISSQFSPPHTQDLQPTKSTAQTPTSTHYYESTSPPEAPPTSTHYYESTSPPEAPPTSTHYYESTPPPEVWDLLVSDASWYQHREAQNHSPEHSLSPFLAGGMISPPPPPPIRSARSLSIFKQQLKTHLFQLYLTS